MEARVHKSPVNRDWKEVYKAALFEDDSTKIPQRIAEAEKALAARALEMFDTGEDQAREKRAMENAVYFLRVLGSIGASSTACKHVNPQQYSLSSGETNQIIKAFDELSEGFCIPQDVRLA